MPNQNLTDITFILDRSGSMASIAAATIEGFNKFISDQQKLPGDCALTLAQFDHEFQVVHSGKPIREVPLLDHKTFLPRGNTALLDAVGRSIVTVGERLAAMPDEKRPGKVLFVIMTDGMENASSEYTHERIKEMIRHQEERYSWNFIFLGANIDVNEVARSMGLNMQNVASYNADIGNMRGAMRSVSDGAARYRAAASVKLTSPFFTDEEKKAMKSSEGAK